MHHRAAIIALLSLSITGWASAADKAGAVTILTQNMDAGTDQSYILAALSPAPPLTLAQGVDLTAAELQASAIPQRAAALAAQIAAKKPDLVALQEATRWEIDTKTPPASIVLDQLDILLAALAGEGVPYRAVAVNSLENVTLPGNAVASVSLTDRDALLVRADLGPPELHFSDVHTHTFDAVLNFAGQSIPSGWISADVHLANRHFLLVTTHLQSAIPGFPEATDIQVAQAGELLHELRNTPKPVVICGDFNSDANGGHFIDATPTAGLIQQAGYAEVWPLTHNTAADSGLTWPYYLEDLFPAPPFVTPSTPLERIDLFFERGMTVLGSALVITPTGITPPDASDHAGVLAVVQP